MQTGQYIYLLIAFVLFGTFAVALNRFQVSSTLTTVESQQANDAMALAQYFIEVAWTKSYDEVTVPANQINQSDLTFPGAFTSPGSLGRDSGENYPNFDDGADYNGLDVTMPYGADSLRVRASVFYADSAVDSLHVGYRTYNKMLKLHITSPRTKVNVTMEQVFAYFGTD